MVVESGSLLAYLEQVRVVITEIFIVAIHIQQNELLLQEVRMIKSQMERKLELQKSDYLEECMQWLSAGTQTIFYNIMRDNSGPRSRKWHSILCYGDTSITTVQHIHEYQGTLE